MRQPEGANGFHEVAGQTVSGGSVFVYETQPGIKPHSGRCKPGFGLRHRIEVSSILRRPGSRRAAAIPITATCGCHAIHTHFAAMRTSAQQDPSSRLSSAPYACHRTAVFHFGVLTEFVSFPISSRSTRAFENRRYSAVLPVKGLR